MAKACIFFAVFTVVLVSWEIADSILDHYRHRDMAGFTD